MVMTEKNASDALVAAHILSNIPQYIFWKDSNSIYLGCNANFAQAVGLTSPHEIIGKTDLDLPWPKHYADIYLKEDKKILRGEKIVDKEVNIIFADGIERIILVNKVPVFSPTDKTITILGIFNDITVLKKQQVQLEKAVVEAELANEVKTQFIQNMQHDLRTPTAGIYGIFDLLMEANTLEECHSLIPYAQKAAKELLELCNTVIDFENISQGNKPIFNKRLDVKLLVNHICDLNAAAAKHKGLEIETLIDERIPPFVKGDKYRLQKILTNLVGNSIKFTETGKIKITAELVSIENNKVIIEFAVHDTGIGIPEDKKAIVYDKFVRLNPSSQGMYKGSGLGLNIVKKCVDELNGEIRLESELHKGTSFFVTLIFESFSEDKDKNLMSGISLDSNSQFETKPYNIGKEHLSFLSCIQDVTTDTSYGKKLKVLLVEDNKLALLAATSVLRNFGCEIIAVSSVQEAQIRLDKEPVHLVISDLGLPDGSGFDIVAHVQATKNHINKSTPFVALSAHMNEDIKQEAYAKGFSYFLSKPINAQSIKSITEVCLKQVERTAEQEDSYEQLPIIDLESSMKLMGGSSEVVKELLAMLIQILPEDMQALQVAVEKNQLKKVRDALHKIKGGLSYCSVPRFKAVVEEFHEQLKDPKKEVPLLPAFKKIEKEWQVLKEAFEGLQVEN